MGWALKYSAVWVAYAIWSGLGIVLIASIGDAPLGQRLDRPALFGLAMIHGGILVIICFCNPPSIDAHALSGAKFNKNGF